ncbi:unnamed protein product [Prunus armeniaca]
MSNLSRVLERQQKQREEIRHKRAQEDQDADEEDEQMLAAAVCMMDQSRQHRRRRAPNVERRRESRVENLYTMEYLRKPTPRDLQRLLQKGEARGFPGMIGSIDCMHWQWKNCPTAWQGEYGNRKGQKSIILEAVALFDCWVWHAFFGVARSQNDLNVLGQSLVFDEVLRGHSPQVTWTTFVKTIPNPQSEKERSFASFQEGYRKDVERCSDILQARWAIIRGAAWMLDEEDEYDYDDPEVFEPDPMNTALTRIYESSIGTVTSGWSIQQPHD